MSNAESIYEYATRSGFKEKTARELQSFMKHAEGKIRVDTSQPEIWSKWIEKGIADRETNSVIIDKELNRECQSGPDF